MAFDCHPPHPQNLQFTQQIFEGENYWMFRGKYESKSCTIKVHKTKDNNNNIEHEILRVLINTENVCNLQHILVSDNKEYTYLIFDEFETSLDKTFIKGNLNFKLSKRINFAIQICQGMIKLHEKKIIMSDLKPANIFLDKSMKIVLCNFALSFIGEDKISPNGNAPGTILYMAPEIFKNNTYDNKIDIYSFGLVLYQLLEQKEVFRDLTFEITKLLRNRTEFSSIKSMNDDFKKEMIKEFSRRIIGDENTQGARPSFSEEYKAEKFKNIRNLITRCWDNNPDKRPPFTEILGELYKIMAEISIPAPSPREFWEKSIKEYEVTFGKFAFEFLKYIEIDIDLQNLFANVLMLYKFFGNKSDGKEKELRDQLKAPSNSAEIIRVIDDHYNSLTVTIDSFGDFINCHFRKNNNTNLMSNIYSLYNTAGFHGVQKAFEVINELKKAPNKFTVRYSISSPGTFSFSVNTEGTIKHYQTNRKADCEEYFCKMNDHYYGNHDFIALIQEIMKNEFKNIEPLRMDIDSWDYRI